MKPKDPAAVKLGRKGGQKDNPLTDREMLIAEFAYKCCEKGDNIDMMWLKLANFWTKP